MAIASAVSLIDCLPGAPGSPHAIVDPAQQQYLVAIAGRLNSLLDRPEAHALPHCKEMSAQR